MSGTLMGQLLLALSTAAVVALISVSVASADTITVANTDNTGPGSLRDAVENQAGNGDTVVVPPGRYELTTGGLFVGYGMTIRGAGARRTIVDVNGGGAVFFVTAVSAATLAEMTITGGNAGGASTGGGVRADTDVVLDGVALVGNTSGGPTADGGGIATQFNSGVSLTIRDSLIAGNQGYNGGGILSGGPLTVNNSTITNNTSGNEDNNGYGGGIYADDGSNVLIQSSTIAGNRDFSGGNLPQGAAGVVLNPGDPVPWAIQNSILAGNTSYLDNGMDPGTPGNPGVENNCNDDAAIPLELNNLESGTDCQFDDPTSQQGKDPKLGALLDNGGQTDTMALLAGSPALNRGLSCIPDDQRGLDRTLGGVCDLGAYELVLCGGVAVNRFGTAGKDTLVGTGAADGILGFAGNDLLRGLGGKDSLCGNAGRDRLLGGKGRDKLFGGKGRDRLRGGPGRDRLRGGPGRDRQVQ